MNRKVQKWWYFPDNRLNIFVTVIPDPEGLQWTIRKRGRLKRRDGRCFLLTIPEHPFYRKRNVFLRSGISQFSLFEDHKGPLRPAARFFLSSRRVEALLLVRHYYSWGTQFQTSHVLPRGPFIIPLTHGPQSLLHPSTHTHVDTVTVDFVTGEEGISIVRGFNHHRRFFWIDSTRQKFPLFTRRFHLPSQMLSNAQFSPIILFISNCQF